MKRLLYKYLFSVLLSCATFMSYGQALRTVPDSVAKNMQKDQAFWYANDPAFWTEQPPPPFVSTIANIFSSNVFRWTIYALLAAVVAFVIYRIVAANNFFARRGSVKKINGDSHPDEAPEDIDKLLAEAISSEQYRLATRFYYLKTLALLSSLDKIRLHAKSTNQEYIQQMRAQPNAREFGDLTRVYEYVWYGQFLPSATQFQMISEAFNQFNRHP